MSVVVFGSINFDLTTYVPRLPARGETLKGHSFITVPGGKGANQAAAAARLGQPTALFGRVGGDAFGRDLLASITAEGVDTAGVVPDAGHGTGLAVISVDDNADNAIIIVAGANGALDGTDVMRCAPALEDASVLMLQLEVPVEANLAVMREARQRGVLVILDPAPAVPLPGEAYRLCDIITPNETETEILTGIRPDNRDHIAQAADILLARGVNTVVIKLGAEGVYYAGGGARGFVPAFAVDAVDTVAAGDAFNGGLATALAEGLPLEEAVRFGAAAGAVAVTRAGAMPSMPYRHDVDSLLGRG